MSGLEIKLAGGALVAAVVQAAGVLIWSGSAAERLSGLEEEARETRPVIERLARVETELEAMRAQLDRIEEKLP